MLPYLAKPAAYLRRNVLGCVDIWDYVILSDQRERRIPPSSWDSQTKQGILRRFAPQNDNFLQMSTEPSTLSTVI